MDKPKTAYFTYQTAESFYERLLFLDIFVIAKYQHMHLIFVVSRTILCSTTGNLMEFFQSSVVFEDIIYVGYVLKVPPVSYFYI